ncbi:glycosyltransferase [Chungangia koreensis]|uniref:Glycosyltransferase n=1 Tax=Chungangia koreensis TaxID=752657 RepID=A0ABV8X356_9LACT
MKKNKMIIEKAKNGRHTCKYEIKNGVFKYLYSKYTPENIQVQYNINADADCLVVLGLGLGYEIEIIKSLTNKPIFVIEYDPAFYDYIQNDRVLNNVKVFIEEEYKNFSFENKKVQYIINYNLIECNTNFYKNVMEFYKNSINKSRTIIVYDHPTIAKDCAISFEKMGFNVKILQLNDLNKVYKDIIEVQPDYIFTVNFINVIADICEQLQTLYISWTVDTPCYTLYEREINYNYSILFVYDEAVVNDLKTKGIKNVDYMPVAANVDRLNKIVLNNNDIQKYSSDVSFLGSCTSHNEYMNIIKPRLSLPVQELIEKLINAQMYSEQFLIKELVEEDIVDLVNTDAKISFNKDKYLNLSINDAFSFLLGRYHTFVERTTYMAKIAEKYKTRLYGEKGWLLNESPYIHKAYRKEVEHFIEMPKVFKCSKINLNITRSFVESGLPMRVFDVLGSNAFLITNNKKDIQQLFSPDKDLVVYRDLQDLLELIDYYLLHENKRNIIRQQGFETLSKYHTYDIRLKRILDKVDKYENELKGFGF